MAKLPTPDDAARTILAVCRELNLRPEDAFPGKPIYYRTVVKGNLTQEEFRNGVDRCRALGWFEKTNDGRDLLTETGFKEM